MNIKDFKIIDRRHIAPYPVYLVTPSYDAFRKRYLSVKMNEIIMILHSGEWNAAVNIQSWKKTKQGVFKLYQKDPKIVDKCIKKFDKKIKKYNLKLILKMHYCWLISLQDTLGVNTNLKKLLLQILIIE